MRYFSVDKEVVVGQNLLKKGVSLELCSSALLSYDWCIVTLTDKIRNTLQFEKLAKAKVFLGYDGDLEDVFSGYLASQESSSIILKDDTLFLENTFISKTFVDATFQEIVIYCLTKSGINKYFIADKRLPKKTITISKQSALSTIKYIKQIWNVTDPHFFTKNTFYLGVGILQNETYKFSYAENILKLEKPNEYWKMIIPCMPYLKHSTEFIINHPKISGSFKISKVVHKVDEAGFTRTIVDFKE